MTVRDTVHVSLFAALTAALGLFPPLTVPAIGVPITAQSMGCMLAGGILGAKRGAFAMGLFLVLIGLGLPLLAGGRGGIGMFAGPSGGFLVGWVVGAYVTGRLIEACWARLSVLLAAFLCAIGGIGAMYLIGIPWISFAANVGLVKAAIGAAAFLPGDVIKAVVAGAVVMAVKRAYPLIGPAHRDGGT